MPAVITYEAALKKMQDYCAREEHCVADIKRKATLSGISPAFVRRITEQLRKDGYINELRFARAFCRGKFLNNHWGKNRIIAELRHRSIDAATIEVAMQEIDPADYRLCLQRLMQQKLLEHGQPDYDNKLKTARYLIQKGYEPDLVWKTLNITLEE